MEQEDKAYLLEGQILYQIGQQEKRLKEIDRKRNATPREMTEQDWNNAFYSCTGAINQLMIVLSCHDNKLSNFQAKEAIEARTMNGASQLSLNRSKNS